MVGARGDEVPIHGPVVVLAKGEAVGGVVVAGFGEGDEVSGGRWAVGGGRWAVGGGRWAVGGGRTLGDLPMVRR
jgi:hypothetical protein